MASDDVPRLPRVGPWIARGAAIALVALAAAFGGLAVVWGLSVERRLSAGTIALSTSPFHRGALDLYVPLVDWGVRFPGSRLPARLRVEVQAIDRAEAVRIARDGIGSTASLRADARTEIVVPEAARR